MLLARHKGIEKGVLPPAFGGHETRFDAPCLHRRGNARGGEIVVVSCDRAISHHSRRSSIRMEVISVTICVSTMRTGRLARFELFRAIR
jgi:hypothetical protein